MHKVLIRSEKEFRNWISDMKKNRIHVNDENYLPNQYPCLIIYYLKDIDSMSYAEDCYTEYIYLYDFESELIIL